MPTRIPNILTSGYQTPLGQAFSNLASVLAVAPTEAEQRAQATAAQLGQWKMGATQDQADFLRGAFPAGAPAPTPTGAPKVSPILPSTPAFVASANGQQRPLASLFAAPPAAAPAPAGAAPMPNLSPSEESVGVPSIAAAFAPKGAAPNLSPSEADVGQPSLASVFAAPQAAEAPQAAPLDMGRYTRNAMLMGEKPEDAGGYLLLGNANTYGARDPRTVNSAVGAGKPYNSTAEAFDITQANGIAEKDNANLAGRMNNADTNATSRANNAATNATSRANNADTIAGENLRAELAQTKGDKRAVAADNARMSAADIVIGKVDEALKHLGGWTTGVKGAVTSKVPGSESYVLGRTIDTIKANLGFDTLAAMRAASPTGGALGAVSNYENHMLQSTVAALDQGLPQAELEKNLKEVRQHYQNVKDLIQGKMPAGMSQPSGEQEWVRGPDGQLHPPGE